MRFSSRLAFPTGDWMRQAWTGPAPGDVTLPVYFHWEFATGPEGDFEALARRLVPVKCPPQVGQTRMDVSVGGPGLEVPSPAPTASEEFADNAMRLRGALRRLGPDAGLQALSQVTVTFTDRLPDAAILTFGLAAAALVTVTVAVAEPAQVRKSLAETFTVRPPVAAKLVSVVGVAVERSVTPSASKSQS